VDIKDFILIGGGVLITAVVAHGFWIAWKARREPLRLDIAADLIPRDGADDAFPAELPNGPSRPVRRGDAADFSDEAQDEFQLEPPMMIDPLEQSAPPPRRRAVPAATSASTPGAQRPERGAADEQPELWDLAAASDGAGRAVDGAGDRQRTEPSLGASVTAANDPAADAAGSSEPAPATAGEDQSRPQVTGVELPSDGLVPDRRDSVRARRSPGEAGQPRSRGAGVSAFGQRRGGVGGESEPAPANRPGRQATAGRAGDGARPEPGRSAPAPQPEVEELVVINVLAPRGQPYTGDELMAALRGRGLKFGDMNIFHRVDPLPRARLFSVANVIEPGTFELADMASVRTPGVCLFMQLPGPERPREVFDDMLAVARALAEQLGGDLFDEQRSVMTPQTVAHYRQRIADFSRRLMSKRA